MTNGLVNRKFFLINTNKKFLLEYRFPVWLTIFFFLIFSIPTFAFLGFLTIAKILGFSTLILVIIALRIWLQSAKKKSSKVERIVLNKNHVFELERKYPFFRNQDASLKQILIHRTGLILAEVIFIPMDVEISFDDLLEIAFNLSIILIDQDYQSYNGLQVKISSERQEHSLTLLDLPGFDCRTNFVEYKTFLIQTKFQNIFISQN